MEEKKIKFELSRLGLVFVVLFALCLLIWTFILGVWIGTKIGGKREGEEIALKSEGISPSTVTNQTENVTSSTKETQNETALTPGNQTVANLTEKPKEEVKAQAPATPVEKPVKEESKEPKTPKKAEVAKKTEEKQVPRKEEKPSYTKKEVAQLASHIKEHGYFIQIGAFSQKDKALALKEKAGREGFTAMIKEINSDGKILYKVLIGGYSSRDEAEKLIGKVKEKLGIEKPFIVEL
ncbi:MAG: SPOR domain-containing protein [Caldimicrobium sp.]